MSPTAWFSPVGLSSSLQFHFMLLSWLLEVCGSQALVLGLLFVPRSWLQVCSVFSLQAGSGSAFVQLQPQKGFFPPPAQELSLCCFSDRVSTWVAAPGPCSTWRSTLRRIARLPRSYFQHKPPLCCLPSSGFPARPGRSFVLWRAEKWVTRICW